MYKTQLPYGKGSIPLEVDAKRLSGVLEASQGQDTKVNEELVVRKALASPIDSAALRSLAHNKKRILIITSDHTRPMPSHITMPLLLAEIRAGSDSADIRILIATGTHRPMTVQEMRARFGSRIVQEETLINHVCTDDARMVYKGVLPSGGALWLHELVDWAELIVSEGFIEPHFFAGFSGGRKSVLPGIAALKTVLYNHNARFLQHPSAAPGCLAGNPMHADMVHAAHAAGLGFILNVMLDQDKRIVEAFAGHPERAHEKGCSTCLAHTGVQRVVADIVITTNGGYPLDQNVYQAVKGMTTAEACVAQGGVIIMCAALGDGAGGEAFYRWMADRPSATAVAEEIAKVPPEHTTADQWEAQMLARVLCKATVVFVTGEENRKCVEAMHMRWAASTADAMSLADGIVGQGARILVIPDGVGIVVRDTADA